MNLAAAPARNPRAAAAATTTPGDTGSTTTARIAAAARPSRRRRRRTESSSSSSTGAAPAAAQEGILNIGGTNIGIAVGPDLGGTTISGFAGEATEGLGGVFSAGSGVGGRHQTAAPPAVGSRLGSGGGSGVRSVEVMMMGGWHPAAEPDEEEGDDAHHDSWRRMRVEELIKDPFLTPGR